LDRNSNRLVYTGPDAAIKADVAKFPLLFNLPGKVGDLATVCSWIVGSEFLLFS
jgi:hypothetical protein